ERLRERIASASATIAGHCNRVFIAETVRETFRAPFARDELSSWDVIVLRRSPVVSIGSVIEDDVALTVDADYEHEPATGFLYRLCDGFRTSWRLRLCRSLVIEYEAGFAQDDPKIASIREAALRLVRGAWIGRDRDPMVRSIEVPGVLSKTFWVGAVGEPGALPPDVELLIAPFV